MSECFACLPGAAGKGPLCKSIFHCWLRLLNMDLGSLRFGEACWARGLFSGTGSLCWNVGEHSRATHSASQLKGARMGVFL